MNYRTIPVERLCNVLAYDKETGIITRKLRTSKRAKVGDVAGSGKPGNYLSICVDSVALLAHRVAWTIAVGSWPTGQIDHINGDRHDNRLQNLRDVDAVTNSQNRRVSYGKSGLLGVSWHPQSGRWVAAIGVAGRKKHIGMFPDKHLAYEAYINAKRQLHDGCTI